MLLARKILSAFLLMAAISLLAFPKYPPTSDVDLTPIFKWTLFCLNLFIWAWAALSCVVKIGVLAGKNLTRLAQLATMSWIVLTSFIIELTYLDPPRDQHYHSEEELMLFALFFLGWPLFDYLVYKFPIETK